MNENKDLDRMMEDFLQDGQVEDQGFSDNVMASLPQQPRLVWITHLYPILGMLASLLVVWKLDYLNPKTLMVWASKLAVLWNVHIGLSATVSLTMIIGCVALAGFFISEKIRNM